MFFNEFLWGNFKESQYGQEVIQFFSHYEDHILHNNRETYLKIKQRIDFNTRAGEEDEDEAYPQNYAEKVKGLCQDIKGFEEDDGIIFSNESSHILSIDDAENLYRAFLDEQSRVFEPFGGDDIEFLADCFYIAYPDYFFPYYFNRYYYHLVAIFNEFGMYLPPVPPRNDLEKRMLHYIELCRSLYEFRKAHNLSGFELSAFLYGFALGIVKKPEIGGTLPEPRKAYFVGGGIHNNGDFGYLDKADANSITCWNGNPDTEPGDIIVMYCLSPRSYIHSIWRAVAPGTLEPFFSFYRVIYIGTPIPVKPITFDELRKDDILSEMPLVKGNMQGINGRLILKKYYDRILQLLEEKGQDISLLPKLSDNTLPDITLKDEKDVEKHLLEPLLHKLGYKEEHWKRQLKLRMGRGDKVFPDYVIFPQEERNNESGYWVWEAKYSILNAKQLKEDFGQAKSYALRLNCKGLGLISKEGVWLSAPDFAFEKIKFWSWKQISEHNYFNEIFDVAGNKKRN
jgi:hypothetical protein